MLVRPNPLAEEWNLPVDNDIFPSSENLFPPIETTLLAQVVWAYLNLPKSPTLISKKELCQLSADLIAHQDLPAVIQNLEEQSQSAVESRILEIENRLGQILLLARSLKRYSEDLELEKEKKGLLERFSSVPFAEKAARDLLLNLEKDKDKVIKMVVRFCLSRGSSEDEQAIEDVAQDGSIALLQAIEGWDYRLGKLFNYSFKRILRNIQKSIDSLPGKIRLSARLNAGIRRLIKKLADFEVENGRAATPEETIAILDQIRIGKMAFTRESKRCILDALQGRGNYLSFDDSTRDGNGLPRGGGLWEIIAIAPDDTEKESVKTLLRQVIEETLETLPAREARVIRMRFGLDPSRPGQEHTLQEAGDRFGRTRERIRQIEAKAFERLRHPSRTRKLKDYLR